MGRLPLVSKGYRRLYEALILAVLLESTIVSNTYFYAKFIKSSYICHVAQSNPCQKSHVHDIPAFRNHLTAIKKHELVKLLRQPEDTRSQAHFHAPICTD